MLKDTHHIPLTDNFESDVQGLLEGKSNVICFSFTALDASPREAATIMSFPNDFVFEGSIAQQWRQIGNAVAPLLGKALGKAIFDTNKKKKKAKTKQPRIVKSKAFDYEDDMLDENHAITDF